MKIDKISGILEEAELIPSPNCDDRPNPSNMKLLVIHNISLPPGEFGTPHITQLFLNKIDPDEHPFFTEIKDLRVSSHLLIRRNGTIIQYDFSIGIEMEGTDDLPYEDIQYTKLADVSRELIKQYPEISKDRVTGHCHIAPGRKTDPGDAFDWKKYQQMI